MGEFHVEDFCVAETRSAAAATSPAITAPTTTTTFDEFGAAVAQPADGGQRAPRRGAAAKRAPNADETATRAPKLQQQPQSAPQQQQQQQQTRQWQRQRKLAGGEEAVAATGADEEHADARRNTRGSTKSATQREPKSANAAANANRRGGGRNAKSGAPPSDRPTPATKVKSPARSENGVVEQWETASESSDVNGRKKENS